MKEENKSCLSTIIYIVGIICAFIDFMFLLAEERTIFTAFNSN